MATASPQVFGPLSAEAVYPVAALTTITNLQSKIILLTF
jgi:hypothetical protein